jgi:hypothetical protein
LGEWVSVAEFQKSFEVVIECLDVFMKQIVTAAFESSKRILDCFLREFHEVSPLSRLDEHYFHPTVRTHADIGPAVRDFDLLSTT